MKNPGYYSCLILFSLIFLFSRCQEDENCHKSVAIVNNSDNSIYFYLSFSYPDTALYLNTTNNAYFKIEKHSHKIEQYRRCLEGDYSYTPKIMCFIYDAQTIESTSWDSVKTKYLVLKRYDLTLQNFDSTNWTITYP
jgi:hypothetical protein